jgi:large subunit ribosomal protein L21
MYAIVKTGGKQYRVTPGERLLVERLAAAEGSSIELQPLLYRSDEAVLDRASLEQVKVTARILSHERGEKLRVFKFKPKRGYKRRTGHRQELTRIEITDMKMGARRQAKKEPAAEQVSAAAAGPAAVKAPAPAKRQAGSAAKAASPKKAPAPKKPQATEEAEDGS